MDYKLMEGIFRKIILIAIFTVFASFCFSDDWFVCLGAYENQNEADTKNNFLVNNGIPSYVKEFKKSDGSKIYRIFYSETFESQDNALLFRKSLISTPAIKNIIGDSIWIASIAQPKRNPEKRTISIKDSDTGNPIDNANVNIDEKWDTVTNSEGNAPLPDDIPDGEHSIYITKGEDYVPVTSTFSLTNGEISTLPQYSIPKKVDYDRIKIVLEWGEYPSDLDSHIFSADYHVYYSDKNGGNLNLDRDDTTSYGPETVTIREPSENERYSYYIYNYSDKDAPTSTSMSNSGAKITVYYNNEYIRTFNIAPNQEGIWWHVFDVVNKDEIVVFDTVSQTMTEE